MSVRYGMSDKQKYTVTVTAPPDYTPDFVLKDRDGTIEASQGERMELKIFGPTQEDRTHPASFVPVTVRDLMFDGTIAELIELIERDRAANE